MESVDFGERIEALRDRLQRRRPALTKKEFSKLATDALAGVEDAALRETAGNWLDGSYYLSRYEESKAEAPLASAREGIEALTLAAPTELEVYALAVAINKGAELAFAQRLSCRVFPCAGSVVAYGDGRLPAQGVGGHLVGGRAGADGALSGGAPWRAPCRLRPRRCVQRKPARAMNALAVCYVELGDHERAYTLPCPRLAPRRGRRPRRHARPHPG